MDKITTLTNTETQFFHDHGYLVMKNLVDLDALKSIRQVVQQQLKNKVGPYELEFEVNYPGSPQALNEEGGDTIRRLLLAYQRHEVFKSWAESPNVISVIKTLLDATRLYLVQSHHNCIMTKQPQFSSETHWHKDIRYWNFDNNRLINSWLPLGDETVENGCLQILPGSHHWNTPKDQLDERLFLCKELPQNREWLDKAVSVPLHQGDVLFFHAGTFHAAGRNQTQSSKNAVVFTYHGECNAALKGTSSVKYPEISLIEED